MRPTLRACALLTTLVSWPMPQQLIARGLITTLLDFYLGDASPTRAEDAPKEGPLGNKVMQPKFGNLLDTAVMLARSVKTLATPAEDGPVSCLEHAGCVRVCLGLTCNCSRM